MQSSYCSFYLFQVHFIVLPKVELYELGNFALAQIPILIFVKFIEQNVKVVLIVEFSSVFTNDRGDCVNELFRLFSIKPPVFVNVVGLPQIVQ